MSITCEICANKITKFRALVECPSASCGQSSCKTCFSKYVVDCGTIPKCMWCKTDLNMDFIGKVAGPKVLAAVQKNQTSTSVDMYMSELPMLQDKVAAIRLRHEHIHYMSNIVREHKRMKVECETLTLEIENPIRQHIYKQKMNEHTAIIFREIGEIGRMSESIRWVNRCEICLKAEKDFSCDTCGQGGSLCKRCFPWVHALNNGNCLDCETPMVSDNKKKLASFMPHPEDTTTLEKIKEKIKISRCMLEGLDKYLRAKYVKDKEETKTEIIPERKMFGKMCPGAGCRGFLSTAWKCGLCSIQFCVKCHAVKDSKHECDGDEIATIELLRKGSKPCPKCGMPISRIDGCDQVWTPCCKIAFNWESGRVDNGRIHSPEYYAFLRRNGLDVGRELGDDGGNGRCNRPGINFLTRNIRIQTPDSIHQLLIQSLEIHRLSTMEIPPLNLEDYGIRYLMNEITLKQWKRSALIRTRMRERKVRTSTIYQTYMDVVIDLFVEFFKDHDENKFMEAYIPFRDITNSELDKCFSDHGVKNKNDHIQA